MFLDSLVDSRESFFAGDDLHPAALDIVVPAVEHLARRGELVNLSGHGIAHQFAAVWPRRAANSSTFLKLGAEVDFHIAMITRYGSGRPITSYNNCNSTSENRERKSSDASLMRLSGRGSARRARISWRSARWRGIGKPKNN